MTNWYRNNIIEHGARDLWKGERWNNNYLHRRSLRFKRPLNKNRMKKNYSKFNRNPSFELGLWYDYYPICCIKSFAIGNTAENCSVIQIKAFELQEKNGDDVCVPCKSCSIKYISEHQMILRSMVK